MNTIPTPLSMKWPWWVDILLNQSVNRSVLELLFSSTLSYEEDSTAHWASLALRSSQPRTILDSNPLPTCHEVNDTDVDMFARESHWIAEWWNISSQI